MYIENITIKKDCAIIEFDEGKLLLVDLNVIKKLNITAGEETDASLLLKENEAFSYEYAMNAALKYISVAMRTEQQVRKHLFAKHIQLSCIKRVLEKIKEYKYIDDLAFSKVFTGDAINTKKGKAYVKNKLRQKGVDEEIINKALTEYSDDDVKDNAQAFLGARNKFLQKYPPFIRKEKLMRAAVTQGYGLSDAAEIINAILSEEEEKDYSDYYCSLIEKKIKLLKNKSMPSEEITRKIYSEFKSKGAPAAVIKECLNRFSEDE